MNLFEWLFRNRKTGEITIWQSPNVAAAVMGIGGVTSWLFPDGAVGRLARGITAGAIVVWALQELFGGVNPARRFNGLGALALQVRRLLR